MLTPLQQQELINAAKMLEPMFLWSGSLDEFTPVPTPSTSSFILEKLNNQNLLQKVIALTTMPLYLPNAPYIVNILDHAYVNLQFEKELFLNGSTTHFDTSVPNERPEVKMDWNLKSFLFNGFTLLRQMTWISSFVSSDRHTKLIASLEANVDRLAAHIIMQNEIEVLEQDIEELITYVLAIELIDTLLEQYIKTEVKPRHLYSWDVIEAYYWQRYRPLDQYYQSMYQIGAVNSGIITKEQYLQSYGFRGVVDFELNSPRYVEIPDVILQTKNNQRKEIMAEKLVNIVTVKDLAERDKKLLSAAWELKTLRGTVRMKSLIGIGKLRAHLLRLAKENTVSGDLIFFMNRNEIKKDPKLYIDTAAERKELYLQNMKLALPTLLRRDTVIKLTTIHVKGEKAIGTPVSAGEVTGAIMYINSLDVDPLDIKDSIAVFTDASPAYSNLYRHAKGIIFQSGGAMSHGAIVAREYRIPAISLGGHSLEWEPNSLVALNGTDGSVTLL